METTIEHPETDNCNDEKTSSFNHSELQSHLTFLFMLIVLSIAS